MKRDCLKTGLERWLAVSWLCVLPILATPEAMAQEFAIQRLFNFSFSDDHTQPGSLLQGADGFLYGTTTRATPGTRFTNDTVFKLGPDAEPAILASFPRDSTNGYAPASLVQATDGNFYGVNRFGGSAMPFGSIFKLTSAGALTNVVIFKGTDGAQPNLLLQGANGVLYGATASGGAHGYGTIFRLTLAGEFTSLFSFARTNGAKPSSLVRSADGTLYGTTTDDIGFPAPDTVFKLSPSGEFTTLLSSATGVVTRPRNLVYATNGCIYGIDAAQGTNGSVFKLTPEDAFSTVVTFTGWNGLDPEMLVAGMDGHLYGTTIVGGPDFNGTFPSGSGTIFKLTLDGALTTLVSGFDLVSTLSVNALLQGMDGNLYGATGSGAPPDPAGVFRVARFPVMTGIQRTAGQDIVEWSSFAGGRYQLEHRSDLFTAEWIPVPNIVIATGSTAAATNQTQGGEQYYRVRLLP